MLKTTTAASKGYRFYDLLLSKWWQGVLGRSEGPIAGPKIAAKGQVVQGLLLRVVGSQGS